MELQNTNHNILTLFIDCSEKLEEKYPRDVIKAGFKCTKDQSLQSLKATEIWNMGHETQVTGTWQLKDIKNYSNLENSSIVVSFSSDIISN